MKDYEERKKYNIVHTNEYPYTFCKALLFMLDTAKDLNMGGISIQLFLDDIGINNLNKDYHYKNKKGVLVSFKTYNPINIYHYVIKGNSEPRRNFVGFDYFTKEVIVETTAKIFAKILITEIAKHNTNTKYDFKSISNNIDKVLDEYIFKYAPLEFIKEHYGVDTYKDLGAFYRSI